jgi:hypothetical protein
MLQDLSRVERSFWWFRQSDIRAKGILVEENAFRTDKESDSGEAEF